MFKFPKLIPIILIAVTLSGCDFFDRAFSPYDPSKDLAKADEKKRLLQDSVNARDAYANAVYIAVEKYAKAAAAPDDVASASITSCISELETFKRNAQSYIEFDTTNVGTARQIAEIMTNNLKKAAYQHAVKWTLDIRLSNDATPGKAAPKQFEDFQIVY